MTLLTNVGSNNIARATFVVGPSISILNSPGYLLAKSINAIAACFDLLIFPLIFWSNLKSPNPSLPKKLSDVWFLVRGLDAPE